MLLTINLGEDLKEGAGLLRLPRMTDERFISFCQRNPDLRVERNAQGNLILLPPADYWIESRGDALLIDLGIWNRSLKSPEKLLVLRRDSLYLTAQCFHQICPGFQRSAGNQYLQICVVPFRT